MSSPFVGIIGVVGITGNNSGEVRHITGPYSAICGGVSVA